MIIVGLNARLVYGAVSAWIGESTHPGAILLIVVPVIASIALLLAYVVFAPSLSRTSRLSAWLAPAGLRAPVERPAEPPVADGPLQGYQRVAIALAADAGDAAVLAHGLLLARSYGARALLVHVAEGFGARYFGPDADNVETSDDRAYLERAREESSRPGVTAEVRLLYGAPVEELTRMVTRENVDLLVMGAHGHGAMGDILFGSTASPVRHRVRIPVFIVRSDRAKN